MTLGKKTIGARGLKNLCKIYRLAFGFCFFVTSTSVCKSYGVKESQEETKVNVVITTLSPSGFSSYKDFTQHQRASSHRSLVFFLIPVIEDPLLLGQCRGRLVVPRGPSKKMY
jgi:hypothetical protein